MSSTSSAEQSARRVEGERKLSALADEIRKSDSSLTRPQAYAKALRTHPEWYEPTSYAAPSITREDIVAKADREAANAKLEALAESHRARDPKLSHAQAFTLALKQHPELYRP